MIILTWVIASSNEGKVQEIRKILGPSVMHTLRSLKEVGFEGTPPAETGRTYIENARLKAQYYFQALDLDPRYFEVFADDSGLECEDLGGFPGLHSARQGETDQERRDNLLQKLRVEVGEKEAYKARFVCHVARYDGDNFIEYQGICEGEIRSLESGSNGFGYDPIFYLPDGRSMAELPSLEKNRISHRARAFQAFKSS